MVAAAVDTLWAGELALTCKTFNFWLCNTRVSWRDGSGPGRPSGMPRKWTRITTRQEEFSDGGGGVPDILILGTHVFDNQLCCEEVTWTFFQRVGVCVRLLGVTMDRICSGEILTRHWTGEQEAAVVVVAEECANNADIELRLPACGDMKKVLDCWVWLVHGQTVSIPDCWIFLYTVLIYYESKTNVCRWSRHHTWDVPYRWWRTDSAMQGDFV